jgi:DNA-binding NarL/FixJ family response regulator
MVMLAITERDVARLDAARRQSGPNPEGRSSSKFLVVDHHFLIREALCQLLKRLNSKATVLEAIDSGQAMRLVSEHADIGLILLELNLPDRDGFSLLRELRERHPATPVVVLSARQDRDSVVRTLSLGALGFIPKSGRWEVIISALGVVFAGGVYIPPEMFWSEGGLNPKPPCIVPLRTEKELVRSADFGLTDRQADVLMLMMKGHSNKVISRALHIALPTVKNHVTAVLKALRVTNRTEAVVAAANWDLGRRRIAGHSGESSAELGFRRRSSGRPVSPASDGDHQLSPPLMRLAEEIDWDPRSFLGSDP